MQFTAEAKNIVDCLSIALQTIDSTQPFRKCVKIDAKKGGVDLYTTGDHSGTCVTIEGSKAQVAGIVCADASTMLNVIRQCDGDVTVTLKNNNLDIRNDQRKYNLLVAEIPNQKGWFKEHDEFDTFSVPLAGMHEAIRLILPAANTIHADDARGATLQIDGKTIHISAMSRNSSAGTCTIVKAKTAKEVAPCIAGLDFCKHVLSLGKDGDINVGISKNTITVQSRLGYAYFSQLTGKPISSREVVEKMKTASKPVHAMAGLILKALRSVLVIEEEDDAGAGLIKGGKGKLQLITIGSMKGKAVDEVIVAGELKIESWYNLKNIRDYLSKVDPEQEIAISVLGDGNKNALILRHGDSVYWLVNRVAPNANADEPG